MCGCVCFLKITILMCNLLLNMSTKFLNVVDGSDPTRAGGSMGEIVRLHHTPAKQKKEHKGSENVSLHHY
jgi:hypothetical protein